MGLAAGAGRIRSRSAGGNEAGGEAQAGGIAAVGFSDGVGTWPGHASHGDRASPHRSLGRQFNSVNNVTMGCLGTSPRRTWSTSHPVILECYSARSFVAP